ncbi:MAG: two-component system, NtrC family, nitrogen regulation response regulator NtrX [Acidobacteriota bacterium]|jgi:DNA-binding NtrC family response regulator|nr:two-component system, NtrC family, nitrogen regulation response regulator NtrX [Acidobacteriota bacterium]
MGKKIEPTDKRTNLEAVVSEKKKAFQILVVDDEPAMLDALQGYLKDDGYSVTTAKNGKEALAAFELEKFHLIVLDLQLPDMSGIDILIELKKKRPEVEVIIITGYGTSARAVEATKAGAYWFLEKPFDYEELEPLVNTIFEHASSAGETEHWSVLDNIVGSSEAIRRIKEISGRIAQTNFRVLLSGEDGTGKSLIAKTIHQLSPRRKKRFVHVNIAAIPKELGPSELFGHTKGAFTGAYAEKDGVIFNAEGGTVYLNKVDAGEASTQYLLADFLTTMTHKKLGSEKTYNIDVRVIASVNKYTADVTHPSELSVLPVDIVIQVPPLRDRREDILELTEHFLKKERGNKSLKLSKDALDVLNQYDFPGNVGELQAIVRRAVAIASGEVITLNDLYLPIARYSDVDVNVTELRRKLNDAEKEAESLRRTSIVANPIWEGRRFFEESDYCFLLMPFSSDYDLLTIYENHVKPIVQNRCGLRCERADDINDINGVMQSVWESINRARVVIAEMTGRNPNVFYELGIAHTLGKPVIMITQSMDYVPFDLKHLRCIVYEFKPGKIEKFESTLEKTIQNVLSSIPSRPTLELR